MITVVCPNPAVDIIARVPRFRAGQTHRAAEVHALGGGKGVNVTRILVELGHRPALVAFAGGEPGRQIVEDVQALGARARFVPVAGNSRICYIVVDPERPAQTVINGPGPPLTPSDVAALWEAFASELPNTRWLVLSGSLPPGVPPDLYARMVAAAREHGVSTAVDTSGPALAAALAARPTLVKVNRAEYTAALGRATTRRAGEGPGPGARRRLPALPAPPAPATPAALPAAGPWGPCRAHVITDGPGPVQVLTPTGTFTLQPPRVPALNAVAAGDTFLAGLVSELVAGAPLAEAVRFATACASVKVQNLLPRLGREAAEIRRLAATLTAGGDSPRPEGIPEAPGSEDSPEASP